MKRKMMTLYLILLLAFLFVTPSFAQEQKFTDKVLGKLQIKLQELKPSKGALVTAEFIIVPNGTISHVKLRGGTSKQKNIVWTALIQCQPYMLKIVKPLHCKVEVKFQGNQVIEESIKFYVKVKK